MGSPDRCLLELFRTLGEQDHLQLLVGVDDTDGTRTRGTGFRTRQLARLLTSIVAGRAVSVTRHQLFVDPRIPYTSHNSAACLELECDALDANSISEAALGLMFRLASEDASPGLCIAWANQVEETIVQFGISATSTVLSLGAAIELADRAGVRLAGCGRDGFGRIGALAAVGLRVASVAGRFIWLPGLRSASGRHTLVDLRQRMGIQEAISPDGTKVQDDEIIMLGDWVRPILMGGHAVLLVERAKTGSDHDWKLLPKALVKRF